MLRVVTLNLNDDSSVSFPVEAPQGKWLETAYKLAHIEPLFICSAGTRTPRSWEDLYDMLESQLDRYYDYVHDNNSVSDAEYDAALAVYDKTWRAIE